MDLDKIEIGNRIKQLRENIFCESRLSFSERCDLSTNHLGRIERGEWLIGLETLHKICTNTGTDPNFILYGNMNNKNSIVRQNIDAFLNNCTNDELKLYYKLMLDIKKLSSK